MRAAFNRYLSNEEGSATIEFAIIFPLIMFLFMGIAEVGYVTARSVLLERGLDMAARDLRLGVDANTTHDSVREDVCRYAGMLVNCSTDLFLEFETLNINSSYPRNAATCRDRATDVISPTNTFKPGQQSEIMFIRACMVVDPLFPGIGYGLELPKDQTGGYQLVSYTAIMNEPFNSELN